MKNQGDLLVFIVFLAYDSRKVHAQPLLFAAESEYDMKMWVHGIRQAAGWMYQPQALRPLPYRLCGLLIIEIITIENVLVADWNGKSDPYIVVSFDGMFARTATHYEVLSSIYHQFITLPVYNDDPNSTITFLVFDEDTMGKDDLLGGLTIPLHSMGFNKEIVWDALPLRSLPGSVAGKSVGSADQYGTISFRTLYRSSKVTQFLPLHQIPSLLEGDKALKVSADYARTATGKVRSMTRRSGLVESLSGTPRQLSQSPYMSRSRSLAGVDFGTSKSPISEEEKSPSLFTLFKIKKKPDPLPPSGEASSPRSAKSGDTDSPASSPRAGIPSAVKDGEFDGKDQGYEFSIEMFKKQLERIGNILKILQIFNSFGYFLSWRDPQWTLICYAWLSWVCLLEPQSALMFVFVLLLKLLLQSHPCFPDLVEEWETRWYKWSDRCKRLFRHMSVIPSTKGGYKKLRQFSSFGSSSSIKSNYGSTGAEEYRVYECQRRRIAGAIKVLSTVVKVTAAMPIQMAVATGTAVVAAGTAAASAAATAVAAPLIQSNDEREEKREEEKKPTLYNPLSPLTKVRATDVKKDIENLFVNFSSKNLKSGIESEWVNMGGAPLRDSPSTVIDGVKIKWNVSMKKNLTDKNGWEYGRTLPPLSGADVVNADQSTIMYDPRSAVWGAGQFGEKFKLHRHWVRRRVWIGTPVRMAFESEEPIGLADIIASTAENGGDELFADNKNGRKSLYARFWQIMDEGRKLQNILFNVSTKLESIKNLVTWKSRWITSLILWVLLIVLVLTATISQFVLSWIFVSLLLVDQLTDIQKKMQLTKPLLDAIKLEIHAASIPVLWKNILKIRMASFFSRMEEVYTEVSVAVVCDIVQKACDKVWFTNAVVLTLNDFEISPTSEGGPVTLGVLLENIYLLANHGDESWWKSEKVSVHPKNLFSGHLVSDWEEFDPLSIFARSN